MSGNLTWRRATVDDLEALVATRLEVLRAANLLAEDVDLTEVAAASRDYYRRALADGAHTAILVLDVNAFVGAGGVSYYRVMPTVHNPTGRCAYIMNMYTRPEYRRRGVARRTLDLLVRDARARGVAHIGLEATAAGRPLYEKYGFQAAEHEMFLPEQNTENGE